MSKNLLVLVSGNGTNLQALIDAQKKKLFGKSAIAAVVSDRPGAYALERARAAGIDEYTYQKDRRLPKETQAGELSDRILALCREKRVSLIILAGFLSILEGEIIREYSGRIINLHPSLLPKFGGRGMYGAKVHEAVLAAGERESGCTVHFVDAGTDTGEIILQRRVPVLPGDTADTLAARIHREEYIALVDAAALLLDKMDEPAGRVFARGAGSD
ncbi:MAG: phosphoribosylglycinamide formyltransferase [Treponematales bacterium]